MQKGDKRMRYTPDRYFLHPVLGLHEHNYPGRKFSVDIATDDESSGTHLEMSASFDLESENINKLIKEGDAICSVVVYCSATSYREAFNAKKTVDPLRVFISLDISQLRGKVEFNPQVIIMRSTRLNTSEAAEVFGDMLIPLDVGSPVAMHQPWEIQINDDEESTKSIFQFEIDDTLSDSEYDIAIDHKEHFLKIKLNQKTRQDLNRIRETNSKRVIETVYLSSLTDVLEYHRNSDYTDQEFDSNEHKLWWHVITEQTESIGIQLEATDTETVWCYKTDNIVRSSFWVAQKLLKTPLNFTEQEGVYYD